MESHREIIKKCFIMAIALLLAVPTVNVVQAEEEIVPEQTAGENAAEETADDSIKEKNTVEEESAQLKEAIIPEIAEKDGLTADLDGVSDLKPAEEKITAFDKEEISEEIIIEPAEIGETIVSDEAETMSESDELRPIELYTIQETYISEGKTIYYNFKPDETAEYLFFAIWDIWHYGFYHADVSLYDSNWNLLVSGDLLDANEPLNYELKQNQTYYFAMFMK